MVYKLVKDGEYLVELFSSSGKVIKIILPPENHPAWNSEEPFGLNMVTKGHYE